MPGMKAKKSLGQNFLNSGAVTDEIAGAARLSSRDIVLEIGPGKGVLTRALITHSEHVIAIEKDARLLPLLKETFASEIKNGHLTLHEGDILTTDVSAFGISAGSYVLVANIPYYITGAIFRDVIGGATPPSRAVLLVQHEVADRIARQKKESILSLAVKAYGMPQYIKKVSASFFSPTPKVDSAILLIENISKQNFRTPAEEKTFFNILHAAFAHKRKKLGGNLKPLLGENVASVLANCNIDPNARAEDVPLEKWLCLTTRET